MDNNENVFYFPSNNNAIDIVLLNKVNTTYPLHTHAEHYTMGVVIDGEIIVETNVEKYVCKSDNIFTIPMDVPHSIKSFSNSTYTMISFCIHEDYLVRTDIDKLKNITNDSYSMVVKHKLLEVPEVAISIEDMSNEICVSSFHMIRQFKKEIGLTPHQFQIQCRIRKAQKMLLNDKTVVEVALDMGFYDQSHFVRCFKKLVGMTPASYQKVAKISKEQE